MKIINKPQIETAKCIIVTGYDDSIMRTRRYLDPILKYGISNEDILYVALFDEKPKKIAIGDLRIAYAQLLEEIKNISPNLVIDDTSFMVYDAKSEKYKEEKYVIFDKIFEKDVSLVSELGIFERDYTKWICGTRWSSIVREMNSDEMIDDEFELDESKFDIEVIKDKESARRALIDLSKAKNIFSDIETNTLRFEEKTAKILTIQFTPDHNKMKSYVFIVDHKDCVVSKDYKEFILKNIKTMFTKRRFIFHNGIFDLKFVCRFFEPHPLDIDMDDTLVMYKILHNSTEDTGLRSKRASLKQLGYKYGKDWDHELELLKEDIAKKTKRPKSSISYEEFPLEKLTYYAGIDTIVLAYLYDEIMEMDKQHPYSPLKEAWYGITDQKIPFTGWKEITINTVVLMMNGINLNKELAYKEKESHTNKLKELYEELSGDIIISKVEEELHNIAWDKIWNTYLEKVEVAKEKGKVYNGKEPLRSKTEIENLLLNEINELDGKIDKLTSELQVKETKTKRSMLESSYKKLENARNNIKNIDKTTYYSIDLFPKFNAGSDAHKRLLLYKVLNFPIKDRTERGEGKVSDDVFEYFHKEYPKFKVLSLFKDIAFYNKELNTYIEPWIRYAENSYDGRIHADFSLDTASFRYASKNPNLQNLPKESNLKKLLKAPEGRMIMSQDYSQLEVVATMNLCKDDFMINMNKAGIDDEHSLNLINASKVTDLFKLDKDYDPLNVDHLKEVKKKFGDKRRAIKSAITFPMTYLCSPDAIKASLQCDDDVAIKLHSGWWNDRAQYKDYIDNVWGEFVTTGYTKLFGGLYIKTEFSREELSSFTSFWDLMEKTTKARKRKDDEAVKYMKSITSSFRTFVNAKSQSSAWTTDRGMSYLNRRFKDIGSTAKVISNIHDDILIEFDIEDLDANYNYMKQDLQLPLLEGEEVSLKTEAEVGYTVKCELGVFEGEDKKNIYNILKDKQ